MLLTDEEKGLGQKGIKFGQWGKHNGLRAMAKTVRTCATRLVPAGMRVDVGEAKTFYTRYLSRNSRLHRGKRGNKAHTIDLRECYLASMCFQQGPLACPT